MLGLNDHNSSTYVQAKPTCKPTLLIAKLASQTNERVIMLLRALPKHRRILEKMKHSNGDFLKGYKPHHDKKHVLLAEDDTS